MRISVYRGQHRIRIAALLLWAFAIPALAATEPASSGNAAVRIAVSTTPLSAPLYIAAELGYFAEEGLNVQIIDRRGGHRSLDALLQGDADYATTSDLPIMFRSFEHDSYRVLTTFVSSAGDSRIVARRGAKVSAIADLAGKRVGVVMGSSSHYFLDLMLLYAGVDPGSVETIALTPEEMQGSLTRREIDAISSWEPYSSQIVESLGHEAVVFAGKSLYSLTFNLVCDASICDRRPEASLAIVRALDRAVAFIRTSPDAAIGTVAKKLSLDRASLAKLWPNYDFGLRLDQSLLLTLENEARWAMTKTLVDAEAIPNFLHLIESAPLGSLDPALVSIIR